MWKGWARLDKKEKKKRRRFRSTNHTLSQEQRCHKQEAPRRSALDPADTREIRDQGVHATSVLLRTREGRGDASRGREGTRPARDAHA